MRKPIVGVLSTAFLLGMTASAYAVHVEEVAENTPAVATGSVKITIDGAVRMRGYTQQDTTDDDGFDGAEGLPNSSADIDGYDGRVQLGTKVQAGDGASAYIRLETGDASSDVYGWGDSNWDNNGLMSGGSKGADGANDLSILEAWVMYQPCNVGVKVGHQLLSHGKKLFYDHTGSGDDAIVVFGELINGANVSGAVIKFSEGQYINFVGGTADHRDDIDGYSGTYTQKLSDVASVDANLMFLHNDEDGMKFYNLGVDGTFKLGMVELLADVEYQFGDLYEDDTETVGAKGYAVMVDARVDLQPFKVGALIGYGSGDDGEDEDYDGFVNFLTDTTYQLVIPGYRLAVPGMGDKNTGLSNLMVWQLYASLDTTCPITSKPLALQARVSKITLNEDADTNNEDDVGVELAAFATLKITKNLSYNIELAYLVAGDAWDAYAADPDPDNAYFMRHGLELKF